MISKNGITILEKTVYQELIDRNINNLDIPAIEYNGFILTFRDLLFIEVPKYIKSFGEMGIKEGSIVTLTMPTMIEYIISYLALDAIGATINCVSINYLKSDLKTYTDDKNSNFLVILDQYYPLIEKQLIDSKIENILLTNLYQYTNKSNYKEYHPLLTRKHIITEKEFLGNSYGNIQIAKFDINRDHLYMYTSGTTSIPKCAVFKETSPLFLTKMHDGLPINDSKGDRSLLIIPPYYTTSLFYEIILQLSRGNTLVLQTKYDKFSFGDDLKKLKINRTLAPQSHYATLFNSGLTKGDLKNLKIAGCGGESVTLGFSQKINNELLYLGAQDTMIIGGGSTENGSCVFEGYTVKNRTNETGNPLPGVYIKIIDNDIEREVGINKRGELHISSPASMDRYYNNQNYFYYDGNIRYGKTNDVGIQSSNGSYTMLGRYNDSYVENGVRYFLFDEEEKISNDDEIIEVEAICLKTNRGKQNNYVIQIVLRENCDIINIIDRLSKIQNIKGIKIRDCFLTNPLSGKRYITEIHNDREKYVIRRNDGNYYLVDFPEDDNPIYTQISKEDIRIEKQDKSLTLQKKK